MARSLAMRYVLVVDDDASVLDAVAAALTVCGVTPRTASSGQEALAAVATERPALMLLDFNMPDMDGAQVLQLLRGRGVDTPAILMSATLENLDTRAAELGFHGHLPKPFALADLCSLVGRFVIPDAA
jgi:CheY-like chemotaxis protein